MRWGSIIQENQDGFLVQGTSRTVRIWCKHARNGDNDQANTTLRTFPCKSRLWSWRSSSSQSNIPPASPMTMTCLAHGRLLRRHGRYRNSKKRRDDQVEIQDGSGTLASGWLRMSYPIWIPCESVYVMITDINSRHQQYDRRMIADSGTGQPGSRAGKICAAQMSKRNIVKKIRPLLFAILLYLCFVSSLYLPISKP